MLELSAHKMRRSADMLTLPKSCTPPMHCSFFKIFTIHFILTKPSGERIAITSISQCDLFILSSVTEYLLCVMHHTEHQRYRDIKDR